MKVLVTGGTGFIGKHLVRQLLKDESITEIKVTSRQFLHGGFECHGNRWSFTSIDLSVQSEVEHMFSHFKPDLIYHLGGSPLPQLDNNRPTRVWQDNVVATQNLLHFCPKGCNFVYASSVVVYGNSIHTFEEGDVTMPTSVYGATKLAGENLVKIYTDMGKVSGKIARLSATIGMGSTHGIIPDLIKKCALKGETLDVIGRCPGSAKSYVHVDDVVDALIKISNAEQRLFNISSIDVANCQEIAEAVIEISGDSKKINWLESAVWHGDNKTLNVSSDLLSVNTGWKQNTAMYAIRKMLNEYYNQATSTKI